MNKVSSCLDSSLGKRLASGSKFMEEGSLCCPKSTSCAQVDMDL